MPLGSGCAAMGEGIQDIQGLTLKALLENANIGVVIHKWDTTIVYANPTALRLLRLRYEQIIDRDALDPQWCFVDDAGRPLPYEEYPVNKVANGGQTLHNEILGVVDSSPRGVSWFMVNAYAEPSGTHGEGFIVVTFNDISDSKNDFSFEAILHNTDDIVIVTEAGDIDAPFGPKIVYVNGAFETLTGYKANEVIGETPRMLQGKDTDRAALARIRTALANREPCREKVLNYSKTGQPYWLDIHIIPLHNRYGEVTHFAAIERDITSAIYYANALESRNDDLKRLKVSLEAVVEQRTRELREANVKFQRLAYNDALTGLPNRRSFLEQARQQVARMRRTARSLMTGLIDVDHFKRVNDQLGHDVGDDVLVAIADGIKRHFRQEDVIGRIGGEEFAFSVLLAQPSDAAEIAERLRELVAERSIKVSENGPLHITVSIGYTICDSKQFELLRNELKHADRALLEAKRQGRNRVIAYHPGLADQALVRDQPEHPA